jgi:hypothetical protein
MSEQPTTETMKISEIKQQLNHLVNQVYRNEIRVVVEKSHRHCLRQRAARR